MSVALDYRYANQTWQWEGWELPYLVAGSGSPVVLVHGFGGCIGHWRHTVADLASLHQVFVIDLLGFGAAPKPSMAYTFELWGEQLAAFCREVVQAPALLVGNSVGAIVVLQAAVAAPDIVKRLVLINCSLRQLHERYRDAIPWHQRLSTPIIQKVLQYKPLGHWFFRQIAQSRSLRNILKQAYVRPEAITDELVEILLAPARTPGAADVFIAFISYAQGPVAEDLLPLVTCPVHILWGEADPWEPIAKARAWTRFDSVKDFVALANAGHCPMDEAPELVNPYLRQWAVLG